MATRSLEPSMLTRLFLSKTGSNGKIRIRLPAPAADVVLPLIGANLNWPEQFHLHTAPSDSEINSRDIWIFAMYDDDLSTFDHI
jgi:hypothetical protein